MKTRSEDYISINIKEKQGGLQEKSKITGDELILLSRDNNLPKDSDGKPLNNASSGVNRVSTVRESIDQSLSTVDYYELFKNSLNDDDEDSFYSFCTETKACEDFHCLDNVVSPISWVTDSMTIQDVYYSTNYCGNTYTPNGSELLLVGYCSCLTTDFSWCDNFNGNTFAVPVTNVVEGTLEDESFIKNKDSYVNELSLLKNQSIYYLDVDIVDRVGSSSWLMHIGLCCFCFKEDEESFSCYDNYNKIYAFNKETLSYSNISGPRGSGESTQEEGEELCFYYTTCLNPLDCSEYKRIHRYTLRPQYDLESGCIRAVVKIDAKSSDTVYIWASWSCVVPIASFKMSEVMTEKTPSSYHDNSSVNFVEFVGNNYCKDMSTESTFEEASWLDRDLFYCSWNVTGAHTQLKESVPLSCSGCYSFNSEPTHIMLFNPEVHSFCYSNGNGIYGCFMSLSGADFTVLVDHSYYIDDIYVVLKNEDTNTVWFYPSKLKINR